MRRFILFIFLISWISTYIDLHSLAYLKRHIAVISLLDVIINFFRLYLFIILQLYVILYQILPLLSYNRRLALQLPALLSILKTNLQHSVLMRDTSNLLQLFLKFTIR